jgi:STE24 endopeptidase
MRNLRRYLLVSLAFVALIFAATSPQLQAQAKDATAEQKTSTSASTTSAQSTPAADSYQLSPEKLRHAIAITRVRNILTIVGTVWGLLVVWLILRTRLAAKIEQWLDGRFHTRWVTGVFYFAIFIVITTLADLPLGLYGEHVERRFGISVQSWSGWFVDQGKGLGLMLGFGTLLLLFFNWLVKISPRRYWVWSWLVTIPLVAGVVVLEPYIANIFVKSEPLKLHHAALVTRLETLVARTGTNIPGNKMFLALESEKSNGVNAYVAGMGATKRMVIWDTTADRLPEDEIVFIFGHESGHYVLHHIPKEFAIDVLIFFVVFFCSARSLASGCSKNLGRSGGLKGWIAARDSRCCCSASQLWELS